jgi:hypothetical protein
MGLNDRELSPLSSNDLEDKRCKVDSLPNHYNNSMKRSVTDTIREQLENDIENQKTAYIPSELSSEINKLQVYNFFLKTIFSKKT